MTLPAQNVDLLFNIFQILFTFVQFDFFYFICISVVFKVGRRSVHNPTGACDGGEIECDYVPSFMYVTQSIVNESQLPFAPLTEREHASLFEIPIIQGNLDL